jgi:hypothetical protein
VALVVGRFLLKGRRTGNPVRFRDGPRRCNRVFWAGSNSKLEWKSASEAHSFGHCRVFLWKNPVRRPGRSELGSQKTYQRITAVLHAGWEPSNCFCIVAPFPFCLPLFFAMKLGAKDGIAMHLGLRAASAMLGR